VLLRQEPERPGFPAGTPFPMIPPDPTAISKDDVIPRPSGSSSGFMKVRPLPLVLLHEVQRMGPASRRPPRTREDLHRTHATTAIPARMKRSTRRFPGRAGSATRRKGSGPGRSPGGPPSARPAVPVLQREVPGQREGDCDLRELRRLEVERPHGDPRWAPPRNPCPPSAPQRGVGARQ